MAIKSTSKHPSGFDIKYDSSIEQLAVSRLTNMYSNPLAAAIRETVSNALDAAKRAGIAEGSLRGGIDGGVEVSIVKEEVGGKKACKLVVKDWGLGMSPSEVEHTFLQYGSSSKSKDGETIGSFGLGAKSPLAYGRSFEVWSDDGSCCSHAVASRDEFGKLGAWLEETDRRKEGRGTTVSFPLNDHGSFRGEFAAGRILRLFDGIRVALGKYPVWSVTQKAVADNAPIDGLTIDGGEIFKLDAPNVKTSRMLNAGSLVTKVLFSSLLDQNEQERLETFIEIEGWLYPVNGGVWDAEKTRVQPMAVITLEDTSKISFTPSRDALSCDLSYLNSAVLGHLLGLRGLSDKKKLELIAKAFASRNNSEASSIFKAVYEPIRQARNPRGRIPASKFSCEKLETLSSCLSASKRGITKWGELTDDPKALFCIGSNSNRQGGKNVFVRFDTEKLKPVPLSPASQCAPLLIGGSKLKSALAVATLENPFVNLNESVIDECSKKYGPAASALVSNGIKTIEGVEALSPIRLGVAQALGELNKDCIMNILPRVVLIDATKVGARKAMSTLKRFDATLFPFKSEKDCATIINIIIPPKDKKKSDASVEVKEITALVKQECVDNLLDLTVITAEKMAAFITSTSPIKQTPTREGGDVVSEASPLLDITKLPGSCVQMQDGEAIRGALANGEEGAAELFSERKAALINDMDASKINIEDLNLHPTNYAIFNFGHASSLEFSLSIARNLLSTVDYMPWTTKKLLITSCITKKTLLRLEKAGVTVIFDGSKTANHPVFGDSSYVDYIKRNAASRHKSQPGVLLPKGIDETADKVTELAVSILNGLSTPHGRFTIDGAWQVLFLGEDGEGETTSLLSKIPRDIGGAVLLDKVCSALYLIHKFRCEFNKENKEEGTGDPVVLNAGEKGGALNFALNDDLTDPQISSLKEEYEAWTAARAMLGVSILPPDRVDEETLQQLKGLMETLNENQLLHTLKTGILGGVSTDDLLEMF